MSTGTRVGPGLQLIEVEVVVWSREYVEQFKGRVGGVMMIELGIIIILLPSLHRKRSEGVRYGRQEEGWRIHAL